MDQERCCLRCRSYTVLSTLKAPGLRSGAPSQSFFLLVCSRRWVAHQGTQSASNAFSSRIVSLKPMHMHMDMLKCMPLVKA